MVGNLYKEEANLEGSDINLKQVISVSIIFVSIQLYYSSLYSLYVCAPIFKTIFVKKVV